MADSCQKSLFKTSISRNHAYRVLHSRFPPFRVRIKARLVDSYVVDPCQKSVVKTSISRNYANRVFHSRFPPFGIVLKPAWSTHMTLRGLWWIRVRRHPSKRRFHETMQISFSIIGFPPSGSYLSPFCRIIWFWASYGGHLL